jgi:SAM-dependent methyltransferase
MSPASQGSLEAETVAASSLSGGHRYRRSLRQQCLNVHVCGSAGCISLARINGQSTRSSWLLLLDQLDTLVWRPYDYDLTKADVSTLEVVMAERDGEIIARGYDQVADEYEALESADAPWPRLQRVRAFAADLPQGSRILDIGCGNGVPATQELAVKHDVTGVDISEEQIARARSNVPAATFLCGDARDVDPPVGMFDVIIALYLIDNIAREDYPAFFRRLTRLLRPSGRVLLSAEPGDDPWQYYTWLGVPMLINTVPTAELVQLLQDVGLSVVSTEFESQLEGGRLIEYAWIVGEKLG